MEDPLYYTYLRFTYLSAPPINQDEKYHYILYFFTVYIFLCPPSTRMKSTATYYTYLRFTYSSAPLSTRKVRSHIASQKYARTHLQRTHSSQTLSARTSARTSHVRKCDFTHMCAATQHLDFKYILLD